ncbi:tail fiber protein, partial [Salmonella enterica]|nr:tail fiber protein [Salmonella enterica]
ADIPDKPLFVKTLGIVDSYPAGCPIPYPGPVAPDGYLLMDGRAFSKTLYPQLAKLYVDGVLPDMRGMYVRGWDNGRSLDWGGNAEMNDYDHVHGKEHGLRAIKKGYPYTRDFRLYPSFSGKYKEPQSNLNPNYYSPRGYKCKFTELVTWSDDYQNLTINEGARGLLSEQYFENAFSKGILEADTSRVPLNIKLMSSPFYRAFFNQKLAGSDLVIGFGTVTGIDPVFSFVYPDGFTDNFTPLGLSKAGILPTGVPNVAFNYITKAA